MAVSSAMRNRRPLREGEPVLTFAFCLAAFCDACSVDTTSHSSASTLDRTYSQVVGASGGTVVANDGTALVIPPGALTQDVTITITPNPNAPPLAQAQGLAVAHLFGPEGQLFLKPISVTLQFDPTQLPPRASAQGISVYTAPRDSNFYQALSTMVTDATHVTAQTTAFCNMIPGANAGSSVQL